MSDEEQIKKATRRLLGRRLFKWADESSRGTPCRYEVDADNTVWCVYPDRRAIGDPGLLKLATFLSLVKKGKMIEV